MSIQAQTSLLERVQYKSLDSSNLTDFKLLNQVIFPVNYTVRLLPELLAAAQPRAAAATPCSLLQEQFYRDTRAAGPLTQLGEYSVDL